MVKLTHYYHLFNGLILSHTLKSPTKMTLVNMFLEIIKVVVKVFIHEINRTNVLLKSQQITKDQFSHRNTFCSAQEKKRRDVLLLISSPWRFNRLVSDTWVPAKPRVLMRERRFYTNYRHCSICDFLTTKPLIPELYFHHINLSMNQFRS